MSVRAQSVVLSSSTIVYVRNLRLLLIWFPSPVPPVRIIESGALYHGLQFEELGLNLFFSLTCLFCLSGP